MRPPRVDLTGHRFGRYVVLAFAGRGSRSKPRWLCRCDCGVEKIVGGSNLGRKTRSCGCLYRERRYTANLRHGDFRGGRRTKEYRAWESMKRRCLSPKAQSYRWYGKRGIRVCDEWLHDFPAFLKHIGRAPSPKHSIDRIESDGNYEPGNVRWATATEQSRNRRCCRCAA